MNPLIELNAAIRRNRNFVDIGVMIVAAMEIERLKELISIYERLYSSLPDEVVQLVNEKVVARNANDGLLFMKIKRELEAILENV